MATPAPIHRHTRLPLPATSPHTTFPPRRIRDAGRKPSVEVGYAPNTLPQVRGPSQTVEEFGVAIVHVRRTPPAQRPQQAGNRPHRRNRRHGDHPGRPRPALPLSPGRLERSPRRNRRGKARTSAAPNRALVLLDGEQVVRFLFPCSAWSRYMYTSPSISEGSSTAVQLRSILRDRVRDSNRTSHDSC